MGINSKSLIYLFEMLEVTGFNVPNCNICCIGNLGLRQYANILVKKYCNTKKYIFYLSDFLISRGFNATNIDINGLHSIQLDLRNPIPDDLHGKFDVILDGGTSEHVKTNQYELFKNYYDLCRKDGLMIHIVPTVEYGHSYWFYPLEFFISLATESGYQIFDYRKTVLKFNKSKNVFYALRKENLLITMIKKSEGKFVDKEKFTQPSVDNIGSNRFIEANDDYEKWAKDSLENINGKKNG